MVINLSTAHSLLSNWVAELRHTDIQLDRMRFRKNLERIGEVIAYEISKEMEWKEKEVPTPLGASVCKILKEQPVLATVLRAGVPLHQGLLNYFDKADNAFISAYRKQVNSAISLFSTMASCAVAEKAAALKQKPLWPL